MEIDRMLTLSTAHICQDTAEKMGNHLLDLTIYEKGKYGWIIYVDPEIAWVGITEEEAKAEGIAVEKGFFPWQASGRAIANARDEGFTKLLFDAETKRILGGSIVGTGAGDLISEVALAIEMGSDSVDIAKTIHPHPTLGESVGMAAAASLGACTDIPPARRK